MATLIGAALCACTVGPNYRRPEVAMPAAWSEGAEAIRAREADIAAWWTQFRDPVLDGLVRRALAGNLDLGQAVSRVRQARLQERIAGAAEFPAINANGTALTLNSNRSPVASSSGQGSPGGLPLPGHLNLYSAGFDATWEVDLFGATRRAVEQARANTAAALWARRDGQVTLTAEVAGAYITLRQVQTRLAIGRAELARQQDIAALVGARRQAGFVTGLDVNQQTGVVVSAAAQLRQLEAQERAQVHALAVLLGETPETLEPQLAAGPLPPTPPVLPAGLPSELLRRRPDIREAERRLAAATAGIGVQTANLYPKLNLIGLASFAGTDLATLFSHQNLSSIGLAMLSEPLFNAGKTRAAIGVAREQAVQADLAYRAAVLAALRDVEDALARLRSEEARRDQLARAVAAASDSLAIAQDQYRVGLVTFINVQQAENSLLNARDELAQSAAASAADLIALYKALGGGWAT